MIRYDANMRKVRRIVVNNQTFQWRVEEIDWDNVLLKVWIDGKKALPWFTLNKRFNNLELSSITPKLVAHLISCIIKHHEIPTEKYKTLHFILHKNGEIVQKAML